jgi:putative two-component system response regulator
MSSQEAQTTTSQPGRILIITRDEEAVHPLVESLTGSGLDRIDTITDTRKALPVFRQLKPDVVIMDADVDQLDSFSVMKQLAARAAPEEFLPFVVLSNLPDLRLKQMCLDAELTPFFQDPAKPQEISLLVHELVSIRGKSVRMNLAAQRQNAEARRVEAEAARHLAQFAEFKDHPSSGHTARVGHLSALIGLLLGMPAQEVEILRLAAPLHDVGKIGIPDAILLKEEPLTLDEMDVVKTHTTLGATILAGSTTPLFQMAEEIALYHHENWDGTGYTPGLEGDAVPLVGRIVRVVDAFDAITSARPFAEQWRRDSAIEFIRTQSGHSFDPRIVDAFLEVQAEAEESADEIARGII